MLRRRASSRVALGTALGLVFAAAGCGKSQSEAASDRTSRFLIGAAGGTLTSTDGLFTVTIPPGALSSDTNLSVTVVTPNPAPGGLGAAYQLEPDGLVFALPVTIVEQVVPAGTDLSTLTIAYTTDTTNLWIRLPGAVPNASLGTLTVTAIHFSEWSVVGTSPNDLFGTFTYTSTAGSLVDATYVAQGSWALSYVGGGSTENDYLPTGTITLVEPVAYGATTCSAVVPPGDVFYVQADQTSDLVQAYPTPANASPLFLWGVSAEWQLVCADGTMPTVATQFDTLGINLQSCQPGVYVSGPVVTETQSTGDYLITCPSAGGSVEVSWDFNTCTPGASCTSTNPCHVASIVCQASGPVCTDTGNQPNGTVCPGGTCNAGVCGSSGAVTGTRLVTYWPDSGALAPVPAPDVVTAPGATVEAFASDGMGGWEAPPYAGAFALDGSFSIVAVPSGTFLLVLVDGTGLTHIVDGTATSGIDLGYDVLGRPDVATPTSSTPVVMALSGLANIGATDQFQVTSSDADVWDVLNVVGLAAPAGTVVDDWFTSDFGGLQGLAGVPLAELALAGVSIPGIPMNLFEPEDTVYVHQLSAQTDSTSGASYLAAVNFAAMDGAAIFAGSPTVLVFPAGTVLSSPAGALAGGTWSISAFEALLPAMNPAATTNAYSHTLYVASNAGPTLTAAGPPAERAIPTLLSMQMPGGTSPDPVLGALTYGQFLDPLWQEWLGLDFTAHLTYTAPGASSGIDETAAVGWREPNSSPSTSPLAPELSPIQYPSITMPGPVATPSATSSNAFGEPLGAVLTGVTTTPVIAWAAPGLGTPTSYVLDIYLVSASSGATVSTQVATWSTLNTQVTLPPGLLVAGNTYYARITALASPLAYSPNAPFRRANTYAYASTLTALFSP